MDPISEDEFFHDPPTNCSFGGGSLDIPDPYEVKTVYVDASKIPNSGEGVFLKKIYRLIAWHVFIHSTCIIKMKINYMLIIMWQTFQKQIHIEGTVENIQSL